MNQLKELRNEMKWTQKYLGNLLHVKNATISKYESGKTPMTDEIIIKAAQLFNVTSDYLLGITFTRNRFNKEFELTGDEKKVLSYYNKLNEEYKDSAKGYIVNLFREQQNIFTETLKKRIA